MYKLLKSKCNNWYKIGLYFGVSRNDLEQSNTRFGGTTEADMKLESVLYKWKETKCSERSWDNVIKTLEDLNYIDVVGEVKEYLLHGSGKEKYDTRGIVHFQMHAVYKVYYFVATRLFCITGYQSCIPINNYIHRLN